MKKIVVLHGVNLNMFGKRDSAVYGTVTFEEINERLHALAKELGPGHTIVTVLCDYGNRYQSKLFNPDFLRAKGLPVPGWLDAEPRDLPAVFEG